MSPHPEKHTPRRETIIALSVFGIVLLLFACAALLVFGPQPKPVGMSEDYETTTTSTIVMPSLPTPLPSRLHQLPSPAIKPCDLLSPAEVRALVGLPTAFTAPKHAGCMFYTDKPDVRVNVNVWRLPDALSAQAFAAQQIQRQRDIATGSEGVLYSLTDPFTDGVSFVRCLPTRSLTGMVQGSYYVDISASYLDPPAFTPQCVSTEGITARVIADRLA